MIDKQTNGQTDRISYLRLDISVKLKGIEEKQTSSSYRELMIGKILSFSK